MLNTIKRLRPMLLFATLLLLSNCQHDDENVQMNEQNNQVTTRIVSLEELKGIPGVLEKLQEVKAKQILPLED